MNVMENTFLLANRWKRIGWIILCVGIVFGHYAFIFHDGEIPWLHRSVIVGFGSDFFGKRLVFTFFKADLTYTIPNVIALVGGLLVLFSKEKIEDEFISKLRLQSFQWAFFWNYSLLLLAFIFVYGKEFMFILVYNVHTVLLFFLGRFHYLLYKYSKADHEK
jgi:hypothetical protein